MKFKQKKGPLARSLFYIWKIFLKIQYARSKTSSIHINICHFPISLLPCFTNFTSDAAMYAIISGPVMNKNGLCQNADMKSSLAIDISILEIPHPGHLSPVIKWNMQGIPTFVQRTNIRYANAIPRIIPYFIRVLFKRFLRLGSVVVINCFVECVLRQSIYYDTKTDKCKNKINYV